MLGSALKRSLRLGEALAGAGLEPHPELGGGAGADRTPKKGQAPWDTE